MKKNICMAIVCFLFPMAIYCQVNQNRVPAYTWAKENKIWYNPNGYSYQVFRENDTALGTAMDIKVDRPPLLTSDCLLQNNPQACTDQVLRTELQNVRYPSDMRMQNHPGVEYVFLTIDENGKVMDNYQVLDSENRCPGCAQAAVEAVSRLQGWQPAMSNGKPVKSRIAVPVRFSNWATSETAAAMKRDTTPQYYWTTEKQVWYSPEGYTFQVIKETKRNADGTMTDTYQNATVDRPPVLLKSCLDESNPQVCTNEAIKDKLEDGYEKVKDVVEDNEQLRQWLLNGAAGLDYITFTVNQNGRIEGDFGAFAMEGRCDQCAQYMVGLLSATMGNWQPATVNARPVSVRVSVPVSMVREALKD